MVDKKASATGKVQQIPVKNIKVHRPKESRQSQFGPRHHIYVRKVEGLFQRLRQRMNMFFLGIFALIPWLQYGGHQAVLLDLELQRFYFWGMTLWPQDLTLLAWIFIIAAFLLFFVTTFLGRVWCGYLCPQTVWTFIFIWFEEKFEGSANQRKKRDTQAMSWDKLWRKIAKHSCWLLFSLFTSLTFIGYFVPIDQLFGDFFTLNSSTLVVGWVAFFAFCTYGNAGWMRETMCLHMCPYARFQSAMFDKDTLTVSYDSKRGEARGARGRKQDPAELGLGDCIDCSLCVQVCPTGIDIRNGLQYECINCGACVDACNGVMERMNYRSGLIRYTTEHALEGRITHILRPKLFGYAGVLIVMVALLAAEVFSRVPVDIDIIRDRNTLARETIDGLVENVYTLKILNKSQQQSTYRISVTGLENAQWVGQQEVTVAAAEVFTMPISLAVDPYELKQYMTEIEFVIEVIEPTNIDIRHSEPSRFFNKR